MTDDSRFEHVPGHAAMPASSAPPRPSPIRPPRTIAGRERQRLQQRAAHRLDGRVKPQIQPPLQAGRAERGARARLGAGRARPARRLDLGLPGAGDRARMAAPGRRASIPEPGLLPIETAWSQKRLNGLAGEIPASQALERAPFPLQIPAYPPDLGEPQRVYLQQVNEADVAIMVWTEPGAPAEYGWCSTRLARGKTYSSSDC